MAKKESKDWKSVLMKKIMRAITSSILMLLGVIFLIVGGTFYLTDILKYTRSTVYLTVGLIMILISVILAQSAKLLKY
jgi:glucose uptake protein GlcU